MKIDIRAALLMAWAAALMALAAFEPVLARSPQNTEGQLQYTLGNGYRIALNIQMGALTSQPVTVYYDEGIVVLAQRDDQSFTMQSGENILSENGAYELHFSLSAAALEQQGGHQLGELMSCSVTFIIQTAPTAQLHAVNPPQGFKISQVNLNGQPLSGVLPNQLFLEQDGQYDITFTKGGTQQQLQLLHDTTPPLLTFNGSTKTQHTQSHVVVNCTEADSKISVTRNGAAYTMQNNTLSGAGNYLLQVTDTAQNQTQYLVRILPAGVVNPRGLLLLLALLLVLAVGYYIRCRVDRLIVR